MQNRQRILNTDVELSLNRSPGNRMVGPKLGADRTKMV
jgi:hypothetical protein